MIALNETSLPLVGTLLTVVLNTQVERHRFERIRKPGRAERRAAAGGDPVAGPGFLHGSRGNHGCRFCPVRDDAPPPARVCSRRATHPGKSSAEEGGDEPIADRVPQEASTWSRFFPDVDEVFDQIREENQAVEFGADEPGAADESARGSSVEPLSLSVQAIDQVLRWLGAEPQEPRNDSGHASAESEPQSTGGVSAGMPLIVSLLLVTRLLRSIREAEPQQCPHRNESVGSLIFFPSAGSADNTRWAPRRSWPRRISLAVIS